MSAIGVFDSGVGGLTVLRALRERWPAQDFIYLADTARLPYGTKSIDTISHYCAQNLSFLMRYEVRAIVVACNSASTALLRSPLDTAVPVFDVIHPGSRRAVEVSRTGRIGVLGTRATVAGGAYPREISKLRADAEVLQQPCPLLVPLVEEGWTDDPVTNLIVYRYINQFAEFKPDTLIMGCTHYPTLRAAIARAAGPGVELVDSAQGVIEDLEALRLPETGAAGRIRVLATDYSTRLEETVRLLLGPHAFDPIELVNLN